LVGHAATRPVFVTFGAALNQIRFPAVEENGDWQYIDLTAANLGSLILGEFLQQPHKINLVKLKVVFFLVTFVFNCFHPNELIANLLRKSLFLAETLFLQV